MIWNICRELKERFVVITLVQGRGHIPQELGAKAIVTVKGLHWGTIGGGKVEAKAIQYAQSMLVEYRKIEFVSWHLNRDVGMTCGGEMSLLFEAHQMRPWKIAVFGAGHVAQALVPLLATLDCEITCIDSRSEWIDRLPKNEKVIPICEAPDQVVAKIASESFFVSLTQGHSFDVPVLREIFRSHPEARFVGVIGSPAKASRIRRELLDFGVSNSFIEKIHCHQ